MPLPKVLLNGCKPGKPQYGSLKIGDKGLSRRDCLSFLDNDLLIRPDIKRHLPQTGMLIVKGKENRDNYVFFIGASDKYEDKIYNNGDVIHACGTVFGENDFNHFKTNQTDPLTKVFVFNGYDEDRCFMGVYTMSSLRNAEQAKRLCSENIVQCCKGGSSNITLDHPTVKKYIQKRKRDANKKQKSKLGRLRTSFNRYQWYR